MTDKDTITLPREVVEGALEALDSEHPDIQLRAAIALRTALAAPRLEVTVDPRLTAEEAAAISAAIDARKKEQSDDLLREFRNGAFVQNALAAEQEKKTPAWWMDGLAATLMREGVNKHRAREIAVGYWEAYCQIPRNEEEPI